MAFLERWRNALFKSDDKSQNKALKYVTQNIDPLLSWQIEKELGDGAFGKVYMAKHSNDNREAALKQVKAIDVEDIEDNSIEILILSELKHPNIVMLHETYLFEEKFWLFLEFCGGGAIDTIMLSLEKPLTETQIQCVARGLCMALEFLHKNFIIHRDVKAGNILLTSEGVVKLADFGVSAKNENSRKLRDTFIGTPYWMSPEVICCETSKQIPYNFKADVWSTGITLIECAEMDPPYHDMHPMRVLMKIQKSDPPFLSKPKLWSNDFADFLSSCLVKDLSTRSTTTQLLEHVFISQSPPGNSVLKQLLNELNAEVVEEYLDEFSDASTEQSSERGETLSMSSSTASILDDSGSNKLYFDDDLCEEILDSIIYEVVTSTQVAPSVPGIVFEVIVKLVSTNNNVQEKNASKAQVPTPVWPSEPKPNKPPTTHAKIATPVWPSEPKPSEPPTTHAKSELSQSKSIEIDNFDSGTRRIIEEIYDEIVFEVIRSPNRQPSAAGIVLDVITEMIQGMAKKKQAPKGVANGVLNTPDRTRNLTHQPTQSRRPSHIGSPAVNMQPNGEVHSRAGYKRTMTKTRKFVNEQGQMVTTRTQSIIVVGEENRQQLNHNIRRYDMRELKLQQKEDSRQLQQLDRKAQIAYDEMESKYQKEKILITQKYNSELDQVERNSQQQLAKVKVMQSNDQKTLTRKLKTDQEKDLKAFKEHLKKEKKTMTLDENGLQATLPRKDALKVMKEQISSDLIEKEKKFIEKQTLDMEKALRNLNDHQYKNIIAIEKDIIKQKHLNIRAMEGAYWQLEEKQIIARNKHLKRHVQDRYIIQHQQMLERHNKEMEILEETISGRTVDLSRQQAIDKRTFIKVTKAESKLRVQNIKKMLRSQNLASDAERERLNQLEEEERLRCKMDYDRLELTQKHQTNKMQADNVMQKQELELIQKEKLETLLKKKKVPTATLR